MRRSLTASDVSSAMEDDAPWRTSPRAMLAALGGSPSAECLPEAWQPPAIPRLHSEEGALMSVSRLERPAGSADGVGGMVVRIAAAEVEDLFILMSRGLRGMQEETGMLPYADRFTRPDSVDA